MFNRLAYMFVALWLTTDFAHSEDDCKNVGPDPALLTHQVVLKGKEAAEAEVTPEGTATVIDDAGFLLTAKHVAHAGKKGDKLFVKIGGKLERFSVLLDGPDGQDWAIIKLVNGKTALSNQSSSSKNRIRFELPQAFNYNGIGSKVILPNSPAPLNIENSAFFYESAEDEETSQQTNATKANFCPQGLGIFVQVSADYEKGNSGSPIFDKCNRLVGIATEFKFDPEALGVDVASKLDSLSSIAKYWATKNELLTAQQANEIVPSFGLESVEVAEAKQAVEQAWNSLGKTLNDARFVRLIPVPCIVNNLVGTIDVDTNSADQTRRRRWWQRGNDQTDNQRVQASLRRNANVRPSLEAQIHPEAVGMLDFAQFAVSSRKLLQQDAGDNHTIWKLQAKIKSLFADNEADGLLRNFESIARLAPLSYSDFVRRKTGYFEHAKKAEATIDLLVTKLRSEDSAKVSPEFDKGFAQELIGKGQHQLANVIGAKYQYPLTEVQITHIDAAIDKLSEGTKYLSRSSSAAIRKYSAIALADLSLALQIRRKDITFGQSVEPREILVELKAANIAAHLYREFPQPWDIASHSFEDVNQMEDAWYLASVALFTQCKGSCEAGRQRWRQDLYANDLHDRIVDFANGFLSLAEIDNEDVEEGFLRDIVDWLSAIRTRDVRGLFSINEEFVRDAQIELLKAAYNDSTVDFDTVVSACVLNCAPVGFLNSLVEQNGGAFVELQDWLRVWVVDRQI